MEFQEYWNTYNKNPLEAFNVDKKTERTSNSINNIYMWNVGKDRDEPQNKILIRQVGQGRALQYLGYHIKIIGGGRYENITRTGKYGQLHEFTWVHISGQLRDGGATGITQLQWKGGIIFKNPKI